MNTEANETKWQPIETIPIDQCVDVWVTSISNSEYGERVTDVWPQSCLGWPRTMADPHTLDAFTKVTSLVQFSLV